jgi:uncharacterized membrane protein
METLSEDRSSCSQRLSHVRRKYRQLAHVLPLRHGSAGGVPAAQRAAMTVRAIKRSTASARAVCGEDHAMTQLLLASLFFPLTHIRIASTRLRAALINRHDERRYLLGYSVLAALALVWLIVAYRRAPATPLWDLPHWVRLAPAPIIFVSIILTVAGITTPDPVIVRSEALFDRPEIVQGILRITRNPFSRGIGLIAIAHVIMIGHIAVLLAFGSPAFLGFAGASLLDAKKARTHGRAWQAFAAVTSDISFLAIMQNSQRFAWREIGSWRMGLGLAVFLVALALHPTPLGAY